MKCTAHNLDVMGLNPVKSNLGCVILLLSRIGTRNMLFQGYFNEINLYLGHAVLTKQPVHKH